MNCSGDPTGDASMAKIYSFIPRPPAASRVARPSRGGATIVIFPGVRYERRKEGGDGAGFNGGGPAGPKSARTRR